MERVRGVLKKYKQSLLTVLFVLLILGGVGLWFLWHHSHTATAQRQAVVGKIGKLVILPGNETPALAEVTDKTKLDTNSILKEAENGDQVLIYTQNAKIIIYRPSDNKIVDIGPLLVGTSGSIYITSKFYIVDGSGKAGSYDTLRQTIVGAFPNARVDKLSAPRAYPETHVVDVSGNNAYLAQQLADVLKMNTGATPEGVKVPADADFLIVLGSDYHG